MDNKNMKELEQVSRNGDGNDRTKISERAASFFRKSLPCVLPLLLCLAFIAAAFLPRVEVQADKAVIKTLAIKDFPITIVLEQSGGMIKSALLRTPAGVREIDKLYGLSYLSEGRYVVKNALSGKDDLLWRTSYMDFSGNGVHLWVGMGSDSSKIYLAASPYNYTKWDNIPAKLVVPKGTAIYISPAIPSYDSKEILQARDSYSFVYTVRMTPEGPAFVPVPSVYRQLSELLQAGIRGEYSTAKRVAYTRMLDEFNRLAEGNPPSTGTLLNFQMNKIDTLIW